MGSFIGNDPESLIYSSSSEKGDTAGITKRSESVSFTECDRRTDIGVEDRLGRELLCIVLLLIDEALFPRSLGSIPAELCFLSECILEDAALLCLDLVSVSVVRSFLLSTSDAETSRVVDLPDLDVVDEYDVLESAARCPFPLKGVFDENDNAGERELSRSSPSLTERIVFEIELMWLFAMEHRGVFLQSHSGGSIHSAGRTQGNMVPSFAALLIHPGIFLPVSLLQKSAVK